MSPESRPLWLSNGEAICILERNKKSYLNLWLVRGNRAIEVANEIQIAAKPAGENNLILRGFVSKSKKGIGQRGQKLSHNPQGPGVAQIRIAVAGRSPAGSFFTAACNRVREILP